VSLGPGGWEAGASAVAGGVGSRARLGVGATGGSGGGGVGAVGAGVGSGGAGAAAGMAGPAASGTGLGESARRRLRLRGSAGWTGCGDGVGGFVAPVRPPRGGARAGSRPPAGPQPLSGAGAGAGRGAASARTPWSCCSALTLVVGSLRCTENDDRGFFLWGYSQSYHPFGCPSLPFLLFFLGLGWAGQVALGLALLPHSTHCVDTACAQYLRRVPSACFFKASFFSSPGEPWRLCAVVGLFGSVGGRFLAVVRG